MLMHGRLSAFDRMQMCCLQYSEQLRQRKGMLLLKLLAIQRITNYKYKEEEDIVTN